jgi:DNA-binding response OmpR family regulator
MLIIGYEPDPLERELLKVILEHEGFQVELYQLDEAVVRRSAQEARAFVIASVDDPDEGVSLMKRLRAGGNMPIVAICRRHDDELSARLFGPAPTRC